MNLPFGFRRRVKRLLIIEPYRTGHGPFWLRLFIEALSELARETVVLAPLEFPEYEAVREQCEVEGCRFEDVDRFGQLHSASGQIGLRMRFGDAPIFVTYLDSTFDRCHSAKNFRGLDRVKLSGVFFWPYDPTNVFQKHGEDDRHALRGPAAQSLRRLRNLVVLDEFLPLATRNRICLPDVWESDLVDDRASLRARLGLTNDFTYLLHAGVDDPRKGLAKTLDCFAQPELDSFFLLRVGRTSPENVETIAQHSARDRIRLINQYVSDHELNQYARSADFVLLPYVGHQGPSGLLSVAAANRTPVLATDFGLIRERVRTHGLGELFPIAFSAADIRDAARRYEPAPEQLEAYARSITREAAITRLRQMIRLP